jgi:site-specific DNA-methyltransferase (adenine-specific)
MRYGAAYGLPECRRAPKPRAHLLAFGSTGTAHRLAVGLENAGLEVRDTLSWLYPVGRHTEVGPLPGGRGTILKPAHEPTPGLSAVHNVCSAVN